MFWVVVLLLSFLGRQITRDQCLACSSVLKSDVCQCNTITSYHVVDMKPQFLKRHHWQRVPCLHRTQAGKANKMQWVLDGKLMPCFWLHVFVLLSLWRVQCRKPTTGCIRCRPCKSESKNMASVKRKVDTENRQFISELTEQFCVILPERHNVKATVVYAQQSEQGQFDPCDI